MLEPGDLGPVERPQRGRERSARSARYSTVRNLPPRLTAAVRNGGDGWPAIAPPQIRHTGVVKIAASTPDAGGTDRTRDAVARLILRARAADRGRAGRASSALSPAAIRRHLDALVADGLLAEREPARPATAAAAGRPARTR